LIKKQRSSTSLLFSHANPLGTLAGKTNITPFSTTRKCLFQCQMAKDKVLELLDNDSKLIKPSVSKGGL